MHKKRQTMNIYSMPTIIRTMQKKKAGKKVGSVEWGRRL